jgi:hypothetical protein
LRRHCDFDLGDVFVRQLQAVQHGRGRNDGRAMLVVVEDRNVHALAQFLLNVEALGRFDVFEVDAAKGGLHRRDDVNQFVGIVFVEFNVKHIDARKLFEQTALALHHRLARQGANIAQTQHGGAIGDHAHQVATAGVFVRGLRVFFNFQAGIGHTG